MKFLYLILTILALFGVFTLYLYAFKKIDVGTEPLIHYLAFVTGLVVLLLGFKSWEKK